MKNLFEWMRENALVSRGIVPAPGEKLNRYIFRYKDEEGLEQKLVINARDEEEARQEAKDYYRNVLKKNLGGTTARPASDIENLKQLIINWYKNSVGRRNDKLLQRPFVQSDEIDLVLKPIASGEKLFPNSPKGKAEKELLGKAIIFFVKKYNLVPKLIGDPNVQAFLRGV